MFALERKLAHTAGVPVLSPQALRHGFGSRLTAAGVSIQFVSQSLGHASVEFSRRVYCSHLPLVRPALLDEM